MTDQDPFVPPSPYGQPAPHGQQPYGQQPYGQQPYGYGYPGPIRARVSLPAMGWVLLGAAVIVLIGSVSPWAKVQVLGTLTVNGTDGDGVLTLILALGMAAMGVVIGVKQGRLWSSIVGLVLAVLSVLVSIIDIADISRIASGTFLAADISVGFGLWLVLVGGIAAAGICIAAMVRRSVPA